VFLRVLLVSFGLFRPGAARAPRVLPLEFIISFSIYYSKKVTFTTLRQLPDSY
jgi:hypothetical protein